MAYADYYERAQTNGVLSIQRGREPGVMIYMLPLGRGDSKATSYHGWGTKFNSFWCCYGTGIESFSKLGDSIYFEEGGKVPRLYIIQYISSSLNWKSGQILLNLKVKPVVSWNPRLQLTLTILSQKEGAGLASTLNLRIPFWTHSTGARAVLNGQDLSLPIPGNFLSVTRKWSPGDKIILELPVSLRTEAIKDDRPQYASIQAILYGPYLLAGLTSGDWDIKTDAASSLSDWITPVPAAYNSHLITLSREFGNSTFVLTNSNQSITMEKLPESGMDSSMRSTFRLVLKDSTSSSEFIEPKDAIGKSVTLEPFDFPGMVLVHRGTDETLAVADSAGGGSGGGSVFRLVAGLDGNAGTVSLESESQEGCYVYGGTGKLSSSIKLSCKSESSDDEFGEGASFVLKGGISEYHPMSFVAKGVKRNFLLAPLISLRDESYTVYFNIQHS
ncbi:hypothetical protein U1Q18_032187 [Sarracenia purpurea var. burkii]